jgi:hypothetical protein
MAIIVPSAESAIRLSANGAWFHHGEPFENLKIIDFFHRAIRKDENNQYYLHNAYEGKEEHVYFEVEDVAYFVRSFYLKEGHHEYRIVLNTGAEQVIDLDTFEEDTRGIMYCRVLDNDRARFSDRALGQLADLAGTDEDGIYLERAGEKVYVSRG